MCNGVNCPVKEDCYRYTAEPDEFWQSYGSFSFDRSQYKNSKDPEERFKGCKYYWDSELYKSY